MNLTIQRLLYRKRKAIFKTLLVMKLTAIILLCACLQVNARGFGQQTVTLSEKNASVKQIFKEINRQTGFKFFYQEELLKQAGKVSIDVKNVSIDDALKICFRDLPFEYTIENATIVVKPAQKKYLQETAGATVTTINITGTVLDENGKPLAGASVKLKGTDKGTSTDKNGSFSMVVANDLNNLVISYVGYETVELPVSKSGDMRIVLKPAESKMTDLVVVGYGDQKKRTLTTAISSVSAKQIKDLPVLNPGAALMGQISGVSVQATNGAPGQAPVLRVRGTGSINAGNSPLYVVDGYPLPDNSAFNLISPIDIESIQVLKDAAACAIYGSRGGNGVVMVTTKKGSNSKTKFAFNAYTGTQQRLKKVSVLNTPELIDYMKEGYTNLGKPIPPSFVNPPADLPNTDWQDQIFRNALQQSYQLSASGGSNAVQYSISGSYTSQDGIVKGTGYQRFNLRANMDAQLNKYIKVGVSLVPSFIVNTNKDTRGDGSEAATGGTGALGGFYGIIANAAMMPQLFPVKYANGNYAQPSIDPLGFGFSPNFTNPMAIIGLYEDKTKSTVLLGNTYLEANILPGLKFKTMFGFINSNSTRNVFTPSTYGGGGSTLATFTNPLLSAVKAQRQVGVNTNWVSENYFTYDKNFGNHYINVVAGYSAQQNVVTNETLNGVTGTFLTDAVHTVAGAGQTLGTTFYSGNNLTSVYARANYAYKEKYLFGAAFRRDGSSRFGDNNKYANFPSLSAGWRIKQEKFMDKLDVISDLKLRASYGETGNNNIGDYAWQNYLASANYVLGSNNGTANYGYLPGSLANPNLSWEKNQQTDLGLEAAFLKDRIYLNVDLYRRITSNLLLNRAVPAINGFGLNVMENIGKVQNQGLEIGLATKNLVGRFRWNTNFNITVNQNKVLELVNHTPIYQVFLNSYRIEEGKPIDQFWGYKQIGVYADQKDVDNSPVWAANALKPGDVKYEDHNHDGKVDVNDMQSLGHASPKFLFGFVNTFQYSNFDLNIIIRGSYGSKNLYAIDRNQFRFFGSVNPRTNVLDRWKSVQDPGNGMEPRAGGLAQDAMSDRYLHDASFLHIANVTLGYSFPKKTKAFDALRIYASCQNLAMFTKKYPGYNPEANSSNDATLGVDNGVSYPLNRTFILGLNLNF
ncbi:TonB-dependent receptor [Chitinophagaceae bacterium 26-R-25]|nr:TonB-dependent receptor [Chitinophagaceae bacterium 26-R-25]